MFPLRERKNKLIKSNSRLVRILKIYFWQTPLQVMAIFFIYKWPPTEYLLHIIILTIMTNIGVVQMYLTRKYLINNLEKEEKGIKQDRVDR